MKYRMLPHAHLGGIAGLLELLIDRCGRDDTYRLATVLIALMVVSMNRLVWRRLYRLAETRYKLEG
jgi:ABC-type anion transport system duplicated permease subunit